jgi:hypothetical protein
MRFLQIRAENSNATVSGGAISLFGVGAVYSVLIIRSYSIKSTKEAHLFDPMRRAGIRRSMNVR